MSKKFNMDLLTETVPHSTVTLSNGTKVKIRAMLVKEYKLLMLANATNDKKEENLVRILQNCIVSKDIDIDLLPIFDLEVIYLHIWHLSKGSWLVPITFSCQNKVKQEDGTDKTCNTKIELKVNTATATVSSAPAENIIKVNEQLSVEMRYPTVGEIEYFDMDRSKDVFEMIMRCIKSVYLNGDQFVVGVDLSNEELVNIIEYLDEGTFVKMGSFIQDMPRISVEFPVVCPSCGHREVHRLVGLNDFFI